MLIFFVYFKAADCRASYTLVHYLPHNVFSQSFHWMKLSEGDDDDEEDEDEDDDTSVCRLLQSFRL